MYIYTRARVNVALVSANVADNHVRVAARVFAVLYFLGVSYF